MQRWYLWLPPSLSCGLFLFSDNKSTKRSRLCSLCVSAHMLKWVKSGQMCPNACFPCIQILNRQVSPTPPLLPSLLLPSSHQHPPPSLLTTSHTKQFFSRSLRAVRREKALVMDFDYSVLLILDKPLKLTSCNYQMSFFGALCKVLSRSDMTVLQ